jgi:hypothetical protein
MTFLLSMLPDLVFHLCVLVGVVGIIASIILSAIPVIGNYKLPIQLVATLLLVLGVYFEGSISTRKEWEAKVEEAKLEVAKKEVVSAEVTTKIVTKYVEKIKVVKEKGDVIIKEVPKYITKESDAKCDIPNAFIVLHDSASRNEVPDASRLADERTSKTKLSTVAETVVGNYSVCHENFEQLRSLQEWIREQQKIYNK